MCYAIKLDKFYKKQHNMDQKSWLNMLLNK